MAKKEPISLQLTEEHLEELSCMAKKLNGLRQIQMDIAESMGVLDFELWRKIHEIFPELESRRVSVNWFTGEVTEAKDC